MSASAVRAEQIRKLFVIPFVGFLVLLFVAVNLLLHFIVIRPIEKMAKTRRSGQHGQDRHARIPAYAAPTRSAGSPPPSTACTAACIEALRMLGEDECRRRRRDRTAIS